MADPMSDLNKTQIAAPPSIDPNRTVMGAAPTINATQTIKPVQCPICKTFNPAGMMFCIECGLIFDRALPDDAFGAPAVKLPCLVESSGREHPIRPGVNLVGREGDVVLPDGKVSRKHAQIMSEDGGMLLEDLGSTNGTLLNGDKVAPGEKRAVKAGDTLSFGGVELRLNFPGHAGATQMLGGNKTAAMAAAPSGGPNASSKDVPIDSDALGAPRSAGEETVSEQKFVPAAFLVWDGNELPLKAGANSFGRKAENDVAIADPYVSGKHGQIDIEEDAVYFTDLGSTNGTFINGARLSSNMRTKIVEGDEFTIGSLSITFRRPS